MQTNRSDYVPAIADSQNRCKIRFIPGLGHCLIHRCLINTCKTTMLCSPRASLSSLAMASLSNVPETNKEWCLPVGDYIDLNTEEVKHKATDNHNSWSMSCSSTYREKEGQVAKTDAWPCSRATSPVVKTAICPCKLSSHLPFGNRTLKFQSGTCISYRLYFPATL